MAHTTIYDLGTSVMAQGQATGTAASVYRHNDGVTGVHVDGWDLYITADDIVVRRLNDRTSRLCVKDQTPDKDPETYGPVAKITVGQTRNDVWPSSATTFLTGERTMS